MLAGGRDRAPRRPGLNAATGPTTHAADPATVRFRLPVVRIEIRRLDPDMPLPEAAHEGDAGYDLRAREAVVIPPQGGRAAVSTGVAVAIPPGYAGFVLPRSGLALHHGVGCLNSPGLIDSGYRDEIKVVLVNHDPDEPFIVDVGDRVAQLVVQRWEIVEWAVVETLKGSTRGLGGFGSTGRG